VGLNPLKAIERTAGSTKYMPILRSKRTFVLLPVFVLVKRRNILNRNGIYANKTTVRPADVSQGRTVPVNSRYDVSLASASQRTRARGGDDYPITHRGINDQASPRRQGIPQCDSPLSRADGALKF